MTRRYNYPVLFLLVLLLGTGIGYNLHTRRQTLTAAGDVLQLIQEHYADSADIPELERMAINKVLARLGSASDFSERSSGAASKAANEPREIMLINTGPGTAYLKPASLSPGAYKAFAKKLETVRSMGISRLTLDLRGVAGTSFEDAIEMADEFLSGNKQITSIKGVHRPVKIYRAKRPGLFETGALTVLTDQLTGGAAKIIYAALRDWKRAQIIGCRTTEAAVEIKRFPVGSHYEMTLPTGRYYAPLGEKL